MPTSFVRTWRDFLLALPILIATILFLMLSTPVLLLLIDNHLAQDRINSQIQEIETAGFDLTSLDRTIHAGFLSLLGANKTASATFIEGLSIQARAVLSDLKEWNTSLPNLDRQELTSIIRHSDRYFFLLTQDIFAKGRHPSLILSQHYRHVTYRTAAFAYRIDSQLKGATQDLRHLNRTRSLLILAQTLLAVLYAGAVLFFSTSKSHTRQVLLDLAAEDSEEMISLTNLKGQILFANRRFRDLFCREDQKYEGRSLVTVLRTIPFYAPIASAWESFLENPGEGNLQLFPLRDPEHPELTWLNVRMTPTRIGKRSRYLEWKGIDLSRLKNAELTLEAQGEWLRTTLASIGDGVIATDISGNITFINHVAERLTGFSAAEAIGHPVDQVFRIANERSGEPLELPIEQVLKNDRVVGLTNHTALISRDGHLISISDSAAPIRSREGLLTGVVMVFQENTERRRAQEMIWDLTYRDTLTHLPNQSLFHDRLAMLIPWARTNGRVLAVAMIDIDLFKRINDSLGHSAGNTLLQAFSRRFSGLLPANDTFARIGGDEFLLMLTECRNEKEVSQVCDRLLQSLELPFEISGQVISLSASMGIAFFPQNGEEAETLIKNADSALNRAKEAGRNRLIFYEETMSSVTLRELKMEQALKKALQRREFYLEYQPQVETRSGRIVGAEALVRWNSPDSGRVLPGDFIALAERTGLIVPLGNSVLRMALEQGKRWWTDGNRITVSVNISYQHFILSGFEEEILSILNTIGIPPEVLVIEITESMVIKDSERFFSVVEELHHQGVGISIDDFGTGATALSYLTSFPIAEVKIDRTLVTDLFSDLKRSELVRTIIGLGKRMEFTTTAEGVERFEEWDYLVSHQCDRVQGFLVSQPISPEAFESLFGKRFIHEKGHPLSFIPD